MTKEQAKILDISDWTEYSSLSISDEGNYVIYVKITDKAGNSVSYTITVNDGHTDNNKDHICDYGCTEKVGTHEQATGKHTCDYCGVKMSDCSGGTATCTEQAICEVCGTAYGEKLAHTYNQEIVSDAYLKSSADCTNAAVYYKSCSCGEKGTETFTSGTANGHSHASVWSKDGTNHWHECSCGDKADIVVHTPKVVNKKDATTTQKGYTGDTVCEICGYEIAKGKDIPIIETDIEYHIAEGENQSIEENYDGTITIKADGEFSKFVSISVDGNLVDATNYTVKSGSTIVTFHKTYLDTLSVGKHTVRFTYTDGYVETSLTITETTVQPKEDDEEDTITSPDTREVVRSSFTIYRFQFMMKREI